jgi:Fe2+ or Zn2+ uptake regulation protein
VTGLVRLSKNQKQILEILQIKPDMTTKEIAETVFGKLVKYKTKEYSSTMRSLVALEKQGFIERVQVQLRWRRSAQNTKEIPEENEIVHNRTFSPWLS